MRLPAVVRLSRSFWDDASNGTKETKLQFVLRQLAAMTARCLITTLELPYCEMKGQDAARLAEVLAQCPALAHLDLSFNSNFGAAGAERLARVLPGAGARQSQQQCDRTSRGREACTSAGAVPSAGSSQSQQQ